MKKIGITFNAPENAISMFTNGVRQHALYFTETLLNLGYDVYLVVDDNSISKVGTLYGFNKYKFVSISKIISEKFDAVFQFGYEIFDHLLPELRKVGTKLAAYHCGNEYIFDTEEALFGTSDKKTQTSRLKEKYFDQIWCIPNMSRHNFYYWQTLYRTEVVEVPFLWSPIAIEQYESDCIKAGIGNLLYRNRGEKKKIAIFEPNINTIKWCFPALLTCENSYRINKDLISHVYITNIADNKKFNFKFFNNLVNSLDLKIDSKLSIEARYNTLFFMSKHADFAVSHTLDNPLNYLNFDLCWMGWPLIHNSPLLKDFGYYYEDQNLIQGGEILNKALQEHDKNSDDYLRSNRLAIDRFLPTNKNLLKEYKSLMANLLNL
jgi:hypothetical protein